MRNLYFRVPRSTRCFNKIQLTGATIAGNPCIVVHVSFTAIATVIITLAWL